MAWPRSWRAQIAVKLLAAFRLLTASPRRWSLGQCSRSRQDSFYSAAWLLGSLNYAEDFTTRLVAHSYFPTLVDLLGVQHGFEAGLTRVYWLPQCLSLLTDEDGETSLEK